MKKIILSFNLLTAITLITAHHAAHAAAPSAQISLGYSLLTPAAEDLNDARKSILWNSNNPSDGDINQLGTLTAEFGLSLLGDGLFFIQYNSSSQKLDTTAVIGTPATVTDSFNYDAIYLLYAYPIDIGSWMLQIGAGVGMTLKYELHQKEAGGGTLQEDLTWEGSAMPIKVQMTLGYPITTGLHMYFRTQYEMVSSELEAAQNYTTTINAQPIVNGQKLKNYTTGSTIKADLSGLGYGLGFAYLF